MESFSTTHRKFSSSQPRHRVRSHGSIIKPIFTLTWSYYESQPLHKTRQSLGLGQLHLQPYRVVHHRITFKLLINSLHVIKTYQFLRSRHIQRKSCLPGRASETSPKSMGPTSFVPYRSFHTPAEVYISHS